jgi:dTDP-4-dehydrorhamnose 3,5-epimerase
MSEFYTASAQRGVRWNDPAFDIRWPIADPILSEKDRSHPDFKRQLIQKTINVEPPHKKPNERT